MMLLVIYSTDLKTYDYTTISKLMTEVIIEYFWKQRSSPSVDMHSLVLQIAVD